MTQQKGTQGSFQGGSGALASATAPKAEATLPTRGDRAPERARGGRGPKTEAEAEEGKKKEEEEEATARRPLPPPSPSSSRPPYRQIRALQDATDGTITVYQAYKTSIAAAAVETQRLDASPDFSPGRMTWIKPSWCWIMYRAGYGAKDSGQERILAIKMRQDDFVGLLRRAELTTKTHEKVAKVGKGRAIGDGGGGGGGEEAANVAENMGLRGDNVGRQDRHVGRLKDESKDEERSAGSGGSRRPSGCGGGGGRRSESRKKREEDGQQKSPRVKVQWDPERSPSIERLSYRSIQIGIPGALSRQWTSEWIVSIEDVTDRARRLKRFLDDNGGGGGGEGAAAAASTEELVRQGLVPDETEFAVPDDVYALLEMGRGD